MAEKSSGQGWVVGLICKTFYIFIMLLVGLVVGIVLLLILYPDEKILAVRCAEFLSVLMVGYVGCMLVDLVLLLLTFLGGKIVRSVRGDVVE